MSDRARVKGRWSLIVLASGIIPDLISTRSYSP